jgi:uncharacterized protein (DUF3084 family)
MNTDEKILKALEALQEGQKALQADVSDLKQGQKRLEQDVERVELKVEVGNAYQEKAHAEIMNHLVDSNEINGQDIKQLEKRIERIENHLGLK